MDKVILGRLARDYPEIQFVEGARFLFRPPKKIVLGPPEQNDTLLLLHEVGHYLCRHRDFDTLAGRLKMERDAWEKARGLASIYGVDFDEDFVETELDTYRDHLDKKSRCPVCGLTRFQTPDGAFHCPRCENF